jgi:hypothetical protein
MNYTMAQSITGNRLMRRIIAALLATALAAPALSQTAEPSFSPERVRAHVEFLADDLLEGRNAGERGYDIAARYVAAQFESLGLKPVVNNDWYQTVPFVKTQLKDGTSASMTINGTTYVSGEDVLMSSSAKFPDQTVDAEVVFVGWGLDSPENGFDDYRGIDVRGKVAAFLMGIPPGVKDTEVVAHLASLRGKMAQDRGAIGMMGILTPMGEKQMPWERMRPYGREPVLRWLDTKGEPYTITPQLQAGGTLGPKAREALFAKSKVPLASIFAEAEKPGSRPKGFALPGKVRFERHSVLQPLKSPNVLAVLPGSDPALANEYIVLMAHLDHDGFNHNAKGDDKIMNGAMDNAAGTATMLEVARAFAESGTRPKRSILFAAVTAEEDGLLGSEYLAKNPVVGSGKVVGVVNLDMPILTYDFTDVTAFGGEHSTIGPIAAAAVAKAGVKLSPDPMPQEGLFTRSDHYSFVKEGVPSVMLATGFGGEGQAKTLDFIKNHYHQVSDEANGGFNWGAGAKFARINYLIARDLADASTAPQWYQGDFFGRMFAPNAPKAPRR